jgi:hypothetical protein
LVAEPEVLASEFVESVEHFASYANRKDHFYPPRRKEHDFADELKHTKDLVLRLKKNQDHVVPVDAPERLTDHDAIPAITAVPAERLAFDYVDP